MKAWTCLSKMRAAAAGFLDNGANRLDASGKLRFITLAPIDSRRVKTLSTSLGAKVKNTEGGPNQSIIAWILPKKAYLLELLKGTGAWQVRIIGKKSFNNVFASDPLGFFSASNKRLGKS